MESAVYNFVFLQSEELGPTGLSAGYNMHKAYAFTLGRSICGVSNMQCQFQCLFGPRTTLESPASTSLPTSLFPRPF